MGISDQYDAIIIGAGQAGSPLALAFSAAGRKVALIERSYVGGTCINVGCTPTKTMIASARVAYLTRRGAEYGVHPAEAHVSMREVRDRKRAMVASFRAGSERRQDRAENVDLIMGDARFIGPKTVEVKPRDGGSCQMSAEIICINSGMRPALPPIAGLDRVPVLDSTSIMELDQLPDHLIVLGGGYIGVEFAQMFCRFGSQVSIIERGPQLMGREDADVAGAIADIFREDGITVLLNTQVTRVDQTGGQIVLTFADGKTISGSHLLAALGRKPNTEDLNLGAAGIESRSARLYQGQ